MCYVCATYVSLLSSMCDVLGVLGIFCGVPRECFYINVFVFPKSLIRCFSRFGVPGRVLSGLVFVQPLSLFLSSYDQNEELGDVPPPTHTHTYTSDLGFFLQH